MQAIFSEQENWNKPETFRKDPAGSQSRAERLVSHPEVSLAWWWRNPLCEA
jgi:hypothetical protein